MTSLLYVVQSVPWIAAGLLVGFFVGRSTVAAEAITDAVQQEGDDVRESSGPKKKFRFTSNGVIAALLVVLGIATAVQAVVQNQADARQDACQTAYANGFADALDARSQSSREAQDALDAWMTKVNAIIQAPTPEARGQILQAFKDYLAARQEAKDTQADHPFPPAPRDVCKDE